jgi:putative FmdB family regulatory protein
MPLYEYHCRECGESFDKIVSFSEADQLPTCPKCGKKETQKKISAGAMIGASSVGSLSSGGCAPGSRFT